MLKRFEIIVKGEVQKVAFRRFVRQLAKKHNLFGSVENLDNYDEDVRIVCEGEESNLQKFLRHLKEPSAEESRETSAKIESVEIKELPFSGAFINFSIIRNPDEAAERLDDGLVLLKQIDGKLETLSGETKKGFGKTDENFKSLDNKYGSVSKTLKSMDKNLEKIVARI